MPKEQPERRLAQRVLASEVVELVHGGDNTSLFRFFLIDGACVDIAVRQAEAATEVLFGSHLGTLNLPSATDVIQALKSDPRLKMLSREEILGQPLTKLAAQFGLTRSRGKGVVPVYAHQIEQPTYFRFLTRRREEDAGRWRTVSQ